MSQQSNRRERSTSNDFMEMITHTINVMRSSELPYKYLVFDNCAIHKTLIVQDLIRQNGYKIIFLPPYSPFLNPIEEFWAKLKSVMNKDPLSLQKNTTLSDRIRRASNKITVADCQGWVRHSLTFWPRCIARERGL
jgi:hypothetical protein